MSLTEDEDSSDDRPEKISRSKASIDDDIPNDDEASEEGDSPDELIYIGNHPVNKFIGNKNRLESAKPKMISKFGATRQTEQVKEVGKMLAKKYKNKQKLNIRPDTADEEDG